MDKNRDKEMRSLKKVNDIEVPTLYEDDPTENVKGGFFDMIKEDPEAFYSFTRFSLVDFDMLHDVVKDCMEHHGRGRNPKNGSKDVLLLLLYYVRRYPQYESVRDFFRIPESTFKGILENYIPKITSRLVSKFIKNVLSTLKKYF